MPVVPGYTLGEKLRETKDLVLYRAVREHDQVRVVLKLLSRDRARPEQVARLKHEHRILSLLSSPDVVSTYGMLETVAHLGLVLEDVGDSSLAEFVRPGGMAIRDFLRYGVGLAGAVEAVHRHRIVHKDIKPQHFFTSGVPGRVKLIDFRIATDLPRQAKRAVGAQDLEGTLAYISPEQTGRMNRLLDRRTDLYSLGVTLYELLTGVLPFRTTDPLELIHCHVARMPQDPRELRPGLSEVLSKIVLKLLSKVAEERYATAAGVKADLEICLDALNRNDSLPALILGQRDISDELCLPQRLYGRDREAQLLVEAFGRAREGTAEFWLIGGSSGIGKSALVHDIQKQILPNGRFAYGKFDHLDRATPYAPIAQACRSLVRSLLGEPSESLAVWKQRVLDAVGPNGRLVSDLVADLKFLIGEQPAVQRLEASEAQHRFELVLQNFIQVFTAADHPLLLFLDDLQWADSSSLRLIQLVLTGPNRGYVLVVGAFRSLELGPVHPLTLALAELRKSGATIHQLELLPLRPKHLVELLSDTLACPAERTRPLAEVLLAKTGGNPFFIDQLVHELHRAGQLWFEREQRIWTWDLASIEQVTVTENVVDLMVARLARLPRSTQRVLRLAACVGHQFDCQLLSVISEQKPHEVVVELEPALHQGLVLPLDGEIHDWVRVDTTSSPPSDSLRASYRFLHDRVQQAAYETIDPVERASVHLTIGRLMLAKSDGYPADDELFTVVGHLNRGAAGILHIEERRMLARLNLRAGRRARDAAAHANASHLLSMVLTLLGDDPWVVDHELTYAAHLSLAECEFLIGHGDAAFALLDAIETRAESVLERVPGRELKTIMLTTMNRLPDAVDVGLDTARLLGADLPREREEVGPALGVEFAALQEAIKGRSIESLLDLPAMKDPGRLALVNVLFSTGPAAFQHHAELMVLTVIKVVNLALRHGNAAALPYFYESYGIVHPVITGDYETAFRFGRLGVDLLAKYGLSKASGATHFVYAAFVSHWRRELTESIEHFRLGLKASLDIGDFVHAGYCSTLAIYHRFYRGENLESVAADVPRINSFLLRTEDVINLRQLSLIGQVCRSLAGLTRAPESFDDDGFDEAEFQRAFEGNRSLWVYYYVHKTIVLYYAGKLGEALRAAEQAVPLQPGLFMGVEHCFYQALTLAAYWHEAAADERDAILENLRSCESKLRGWAEPAPSNHAHRYALIAAELAQITGDVERAADLYDRAIDLAQSDGSLQLSALASELCGEFYLARGRLRIARRYLVDAYQSYLDWGARTRASRLLARHPHLATERDATLPDHSSASSGAGVWHGRLESTTPASNRGGSNGACDRKLDLMTAVRASQAIASELKLDKVLDRLLRVILEHAGAQKGCLVLAREDRLEIEAYATVDPDEVRVGLRERVSTSARLASTVVQYVARSMDSVVLANAAVDAQFALDPYIAATQPKSLLCVAMQHRGRLVGVLYLENNAASHVFSASRLELLEFLAAQAAVAVENATLYGELQTASIQLERNNQALEVEVAQRTEELQRALAELWSEMDLARKIQTVLLPQDRRVGDCEVSASMVPASSVGGDYYDLFQSGKSSWLLIGDVSGHGVPAGLSMMMVQTAVRSIIGSAAASYLTPAQVLARVNAAVSSNLAKISHGQYMTLAAMEIQGSTVKHAGLHMDLLLYRASSRHVERIPTSGMWVGVMADIAPLLQDGSFELEPGDVLVLFTDGITEARVGGARWGTQGLADLFGHLAAQSSDPETIVKGINRFVAGCGASDDMTVVAVRYAPAQGGITWS